MNEIKIRTNLFLWLLTGRSRDFANSALNTGVTFTSGKIPDDVTYMRKLLRLDDARTDFYVLGALGATYMSTSLLRSMVRENQAVFVPGLLSLPGASYSTALLPRDQFSWPHIDGSRAGQDGFTMVTISFLGASTVRLATDSGASTDVPYELTAESGGYRLKVPAAYDYGIKADFLVGSWGPGNTVSVQLSPTRYPYRQMVDKLTRDSVAIHMMNEEGTLQAYSESFSPALKVGLAALAVIRRMLREINDTQAGFTVTVTLDDGSEEPLAKDYIIDASLVTGFTSEPPCDTTEPQAFDA